MWVLLKDVSESDTVWCVYLQFTDSRLKVIAYSRQYLHILSDLLWRHHCLLLKGLYLLVHKQQLLVKVFDSKTDKCQKHVLKSSDWMLFFFFNFLLPQVIFFIDLSYFNTSHLFCRFFSTCILRLARRVTLSSSSISICLGHWKTRELSLMSSAVKQPNKKKREQ